MYVRLPFIDVSYTVCVFVISQLPDDGHNWSPQHAGVQKLNLEEKLEVLLVHRNYIFLKNSTFFLVLLLVFVLQAEACKTNTTKY